MAEILQREDWASRAKAGDKSCGLFKSFVLQEVREVGKPEDRTLEMTISTETVDRYGDIIRADGWTLDNYKANPVVLFAHDYRSPAVGMGTDTRIEGNALKDTVKFAPATTYAFAEVLYRLYRDKYMRASSVGFSPFEWKENERGYEFLKQDLLEWSLVPVPANPDAISMGHRKGLYSRKAMDVLSDLAKYMPEELLPKERRKAVVPYQNLSVAPEEAEWDGAAAERRVREWAGGPEREDIDWGKYRKAFVWYDPEDAENFGAYKLPIADVFDGTLKAVWRGVAAALAALLGARGGVDIPDDEREAVYNHLARYYEKFDKEPPEFEEAKEFVCNSVEAITLRLVLGGAGVPIGARLVDWALADGLKSAAWREKVAKRLREIEDQRAKETGQGGMPSIPPALLNELRALSDELKAEPYDVAKIVQSELGKQLKGH